MTAIRLGPAREAGPLRPSVRARRLRRRLRRGHEGPQIARRRQAGHPDPHEPRPSRRQRLRGQHRRRRRHPAADAARLPQEGRQERRAHQSARARHVRRRQHLHAAQRDAAPQDRRSLRARRAGRRPDVPRLAHRADGQLLLGETAKASRAVHAPGVHRPRRRIRADEPAFERKLYVIRKRAYNEIRVSTIGGAEFWYVVSLSHKTLIYKGMLTPDAGRPVFPRPAEPAMETALALVHSRFSTNTFPSWDRAHPYRYIAHNGEINTLRGNINWMHARQALFESPLFGDDIKKILPIVNPNGSDSAMFDNVLELLVLCAAARCRTRDDDDPRAVGEARVDERREAGVLRVPLVSDGAVGRPRVDRLHRRQAHRRDARPQRPAPLALLRHEGRPRHHGVRSRRAAIRAGTHRCARAACSRAACSSWTRSKAASSRTRRSRAQIANEQPYRRVAQCSTSSISKDLPDAPEMPAPDHETRAPAPAGVRLHVRRSAHAHAADGARRRRGRRLDGQRTRRSPCSRTSRSCSTTTSSSSSRRSRTRRSTASARRSSRRPTRRSARSATCSSPTPESCRLHRAQVADPHERGTREAAARRRRPASRSVTHADPLRSAPRRRRRPGEGAWTKCCAAGRPHRSTDGVNIIILSDRGVNKDNARRSRRCSPSSGLHHSPDPRRHAHAGVGIVLETGEPREVHHFCAAHRLRLRGDQSVSRLRDARRHDPRGPARRTSITRPPARISSRPRSKGVVKVDVEDGHLDDPELSRRADLRSRRPQPGRHRQILHRHRVARRRRRTST